MKQLLVVFVKNVRMESGYEQENIMTKTKHKDLLIAAEYCNSPLENAMNETSLIWEKWMRGEINDITRDSLRENIRELYEVNLN